MWRARTRILAAGFILGAIAPAPAAEVEAIDARTPWRAYLVHGGNLVREKGALTVRGRRQSAPFDPAAADADKQGFSRLPPAAWMKPDFDDRCWPRFLMMDLFDFLGDFGANAQENNGPALLCLRTAFGVSDPARATGLKVSVTGLGGGVVYVNGEEVGRGAMPAGKLHPLTPAEDYPIEAYTADDGTTPLPVLQGASKPEPKWLARYQKRIRAFTVDVPPRALVKGRNILAVELHRSAVAGPQQRGGWGHVGVHRVTLASAGGAGVIPFAEAIQGTRVWSANAEDVVAETPAEKSMVRVSMFKTLLWARGMPVRGIPIGNPFDPILPIRMAAPRNGVCSGQAVLSDPAGLRGVKAELGPLKGPSGAVLPAAGVKIRYAVQHPEIHYCDALMPTPPEGAKTLPVWVVVEAPKDQAPGWYAAPLALAANGKTFSVPVRVLVTGLTLPAARDFSSDLGVTHSPDVIAAQYKVDPWSDAHLRRMEPSLAMMGQLGNDVCQVPVITKNQFNWRLPMIRWTKSDGKLKPDFTVLRKYLDAYGKYCAPPKAISVYLWDPSCAKRIANVYEGRQIPSRDNKPRMPLTIQVVDPKTGAASEADMPHIGDPGAEAFYKDLIDGVREIVTKRGWPASSLLLGLGGDNRPSQEDAALIKQWAPDVRWNLLSHFSGDPGTIFNKKGPGMEALKAGKLIAVGGLEVGLKEHPWSGEWNGWPAIKFEDQWAKPTEFVDLGTARWLWQDYSPPIVFRTLPLLWGRLGRVGLDFWGGGRGTAQNASYFTQSTALTVPGPDGAVPTVRFQMMREGVQDMEVRFSILRACAKLPADQRKSHHELLDDLVRRIASGGQYLSQLELGYDWPAYAARVQETAAELAGAKATAKWEEPPK
jgi:hypothetical protein